MTGMEKNSLTLESDPLRFHSCCTLLCSEISRANHSLLRSRETRYLARACFASLKEISASAQGYRQTQSDLAADQGAYQLSNQDQGRINLCQRSLKSKSTSHRASSLDHRSILVNFGFYLTNHPGPAVCQLAVRGVFSLDSRLPSILLSLSFPESLVIAQLDLIIN